MSAGWNQGPLAPRVYCWAIRLYPARFRENYREAMMQALRDAMADSSLRRATLWPTLIVDLLQSLVKENLAMLRDTYGRPTLIYNALILAALSTVLAVGLFVVAEQSLREAANDPQLELAGNLAYGLEHGAAAQSLVPAEKVDMAASLSPFVIAYDEQGRVLASSGQLDGQTPALPRGIYDDAREHGEDRVTWQPRRGLRIAAVVRHVVGANGGFVLAGRNMREIEARWQLTMSTARLFWLLMMGIVIAGTLLFGWFTGPPKAVAA